MKGGGGGGGSGSGSGGDDKLMFFSARESQTTTDHETNALVSPPAVLAAPIRKQRSRGRKGKQGMPGMGVVAEGGGGGEAADDLHLWTERERRKKMKGMFCNLHQMLPHVPIKADKSTIVDEAVSYIQNLQVILQEFQRLKLERVAAAAVAAAVQFETWCWPNLVLNVCGEQAQFSVCSLKKPNISSSICFFFESHNLDVVFCNFISNEASCIYMIQAQVRKSEPSTDHDHKHHQLPITDDFSDIFKRAAIDITTWLSSS